jgi:hypothetical protein
MDRGDGFDPAEVVRKLAKDLSRHLVAPGRKTPLKLAPLTLVPYSFSMGL